MNYKSSFGGLVAALFLILLLVIKALDVSDQTKQEIFEFMQYVGIGLAVLYLIFGIIYLKNNNRLPPIT